jgi:hypothetical protein
METKDKELCIDGKWIIGHAGPTPERQAAMGVPITKFGEGSRGIWFDAVPNTIFKTESIPYGIGLTMNILSRIGPGTLNTFNLNILDHVERGKIRPLVSRLVQWLPYVRHISTTDLHTCRCLKPNGE